MIEKLPHCLIDSWATQSNLSETAEFNLIKSVTAVPSKRKEQ